jgi:hypothetical protein
MIDLHVFQPNPYKVNPGSVSVDTVMFQKTCNFAFNSPAFLNFSSTSCVPVDPETYNFEMKLFIAIASDLRNAPQNFFTSNSLEMFNARLGLPSMVTVPILRDMMELAKKSTDEELKSSFCYSDKGGPWPEFCLTKGLHSKSSKGIPWMLLVESVICLLYYNGNFSSNLDFFETRYGSLIVNTVLDHLEL